MSSGGRRRMGEGASEEREGVREGERTAGMFSWGGGNEMKIDNYYGRCITQSWSYSTGNRQIQWRQKRIDSLFFTSSPPMIEIILVH